MPWHSNVNLYSIRGRLAAGPNRVNGDATDRPNTPTDNSALSFIASALKEMTAGNTLNQPGPSYNETVLQHVVNGHIGGPQTVDNNVIWNLETGKWVSKNPSIFNNPGYQDYFGNFNKTLFSHAQNKLSDTTNVTLDYNSSSDMATVTIPFTSENFKLATKNVIPYYMQNLYGSQYQGDGGLGDPRSIQNLKINLQRAMNTQNQPTGNYKIFSFSPDFSYP